MNIALVRSKLNACWYILKGFGKPSFSQIGEDRILHFLFVSKGLNQPTYLDIGANQPVLGNNTYFFYHRGSKGVCVEPEPHLYRKLKKVRKRDMVLNVGIGLQEEASAPFYVFPEQYSGWNTFSLEEAAIRKEMGHAYKIIQMPLRNINKIIAEYLGAAPDLLSIDVEGLDFDILQSLDFSRYAPKVIVVETIRFGETAQAQKQQHIIDFVCTKGYSVYADTYVNTIFRKTGW